MSSLLHASAGRTKSTTLRVQSGLKSGILAAAMMLAWLLPAAQADYQTNVISGVTNALSGDYILGFRDFLRIDSGGALFDVRGLVNGGPYGGFPPKHLISPASAIVTDPGSVWSNLSDLYVGRYGAGNQLVVSNGGAVVIINESGYLGYAVSSSNNVAVVTGTNSLWTNSSLLSVGYSGSGNGKNNPAAQHVCHDHPGSSRHQPDRARPQRQDRLRGSGVRAAGDDRREP